MENLGRGVVAVRSTTTRAYISWRLLGTDPADVSFNLYRSAGGATPIKLNSSPITTTTEYLDTPPSFTVSNAYTVRPVINGVEQAASTAFTLPANAPVQQYLTIPMQVPAGGTTPDGVAYTYSPNDCSVGDLDGDGEYEIVVKWDPSNSKDNSQSGYTGNVYLDAYKLDGTRLWRIDLGRNIRAGAHYTQFMVYDLDGDGKAEIACKTAPGTVDGQGNNVILGSDNPAADYRNSSGYILSGPEYFTIFNGQTGAAMATTNYVPARGTVSAWGDSYGNRVDRFLACIAYLDGVRPSVVMCRGYYTRAALTAWDWRDGQLTQRWAFDTGNSTTGPLAGYRGQGAHSLTVGDVDDDGKDEIIYGACAIDDDGKGLYTTTLGHGDALHMSDFDPDRPGQEVWMVHEEPGSYGPTGLECRDAKTGALIFGLDGQGADVGRGVAIDIDPRYAGAEMWGARGGLMSAAGVQISSSHPSPMNFAIWWDGDLLREILDGTTISKWNYSSASTSTLLSGSGVSSNNSTKATPNLSADIFGDWREEVVWRTADNTALRIYTTTTRATNRLVTLMHDPQYREAIAWQVTGYNQPPHPSFNIGPEMSTPPRAPIWAGDLVWSGSGSNVWNYNSSTNWRTGVVSGTTSTFTTGKSVLFSISGTNTSLFLDATLSPSLVVVHNPVGKDYTFGGTGSLSGTMSLTKAGEGALVLSNTNSFTGATSVQQGALVVNGYLTSSPVTVEGYGQISGSGRVGQSLTVKRRGRILPGSGAGSAGTLTISGSTSFDSASIELDLSNTPAGPNDRIAVQNNLTLTGTTKIAVNLLNGALTSGTYQLMTWSGAFSGTTSNIVVSGLNGAPSSLVVSGTSLALVVAATRAPTAVTWSGSGATWDFLNSKNWLVSGTADSFVTGDSVLFDQTGASAPSVNLVTQVTPGSVTVSGPATYLLSGTGVIAGTGGLTKSGTGKLTIQTSNSFTGPTILNGGIIEVAALANGGVSSPLGAATSSTSNFILNSGTLRFTGAASTSDRGLTLGSAGATMDIASNVGTLTLSGSLSGAGSLTKIGAGTLELMSANDYSGATVVSSGTLSINDNNALGTGSVTLNNATLDTGGVAPPNQLMISGTSSVSGGSGSGGMGISQVTGDASAVLFANATNVFDFRGDLSGFTGTILLNNAGGSFRFNGSTGSDRTTFDLGSASLSKRSSTGTIAIGALTGGTASSLNGATGSGNTSATIFNIGGNNLSTTYGGRITDGAGVVSINKIGLGTLTLTGSNSYTGTTTITAGMLVMKGVHGGGSVNVLNSGTLNLLTTLNVGTMQINTGGTLIGNGRINGSFSNAGLVAVTSGTLTLSGGSFVNTGTMRFTGGAGLSVMTGTFVNNGFLDAITAGGLPANIVNNGTIVDSTAVRVQDMQLTGSDSRLFIQSYPGHSYQLQRRDSLTTGTWQNVGSAQDGNNNVLMFPDPDGATTTGTGRFYRIFVSP